MIRETHRNERVILIGHSSWFFLQAHEATYATMIPYFKSIMFDRLVIVVIAIPIPQEHRRLETRFHQLIASRKLGPGIPGEFE